MSTPNPPGHKAVIDGNVAIYDSWGVERVYQKAQVELSFSYDYAAVTVVRGWPTVVVPTKYRDGNKDVSIAVSLASAPRGRFDINSGHMWLPVVLHLDYTADRFLVNFDQDVLLTLQTNIRTRFGGSQLGLWDAAPYIQLSAEVQYSTKVQVRLLLPLVTSQLHDLNVYLAGNLSPLPPRAATPVPPECAQLRADIDQRRNRVLQLSQDKSSLNPKIRSQRQEFDQINREIATLNKEIGNLQLRATSLGCR